MVYLNENIAATAIAASLKGARLRAGNFLPDLMFANICKQNVTRFPYELARLSQDIAGGLVTTLPSDEDFRNPEVGPLLNKYLATGRNREGQQVDTVTDRRRIFRLIENLTMGRNAVGYLTESMHGAGSPQAQRVMIMRLMDLGKKMELAKNLAGIRGSKM